MLEKSECFCILAVTFTIGTLLSLSMQC